MRTVKFVNALDEANPLRVSFDVDQGSVEAFVAQFEGRFGDRWVPIARYDTAHGFAHLDIIKPDGATEKRELAEQRYNEALRIAMVDLKVNWKLYRRRYEEWSRNA